LIWRQQEGAELSQVIQLDEKRPQAFTVSVISPMYNEGANIRDNLNQLFDLFKELPFRCELVLVNDGSTDNSLEKAQGLLSNYDDFTIVTYPVNRGRGFAIRKGIENAGGDILVVAESDLSWGTEIVERMLSHLLENRLDVVVASPQAKGGRLVNVPFSRRFYTTVGNQILRRLMPVKLSMYTGMTRAYRREVLENLDMESDGKELHLEILSKLAAQGCRIGEVPAVLAWEPSRKKRKSGFNAKRYIFSHLTFGVGESPLLVMTMVSLFFVFLGGICGFFLLYLSVTGTPVSGRPLIQFSMLSIIFGLLMVMFGFLLQQTKQLQRQIYRLQKNQRKFSGIKK
jgi:glycosyltransferase involved in cell wall biosynthesis